MKSRQRLDMFLMVLVAGLCFCLALPTPATAEPKNEGGQLVSIDFNNVDIGVFIKFVSDLTQKNFIVDDKVRGKVTIISPGKITVSEAYQVFLSVLEVYGYTTVRAGRVTKIVPSPDARAKNIKTRIEEESGRDDDAVITQLIPLRYADPNEIKTLFTPLVSKSSVIQAYDPTNTLIITDVASNVKRLLKILKAIDITGVGQQIAIIPVENASAPKLVSLLQSIFKTTTKGARRRSTSNDITFVADERTNVIVVLASEGEVDNIRKLVTKLDQEAPKDQSNINVYYLEHATAEDVVKVLMDIPQKGGTDPKQGGKITQPVVSKNVRITADKATNSLIIMADLDDYMVLESIIKKIDIPRAMVYIEALIMEVNATKNFSLGTQWLLGSQTSYEGKNMVYGGQFQGESSIGGLTSLPSSGTETDGGAIPVLSNPGMSVGIFGEAINISGISFPSISAIINAYKMDSDVRILSTPQILTTDNQEAKIYVGTNRAFQTTTSTSQSIAGDVYNSYEYRDVGKTLTITPQISKDRMVRLSISLEVSSVEDPNDNKPTTLKRTVETTTICKDGNYVVLGGLIEDTGSSSNLKVPCLGDIPGLGYLFGSKATAFEKTNLYIFLTPRVIQNPEESNRISHQKYKQIKRLRDEKINLFDDGDMPPMEDLRMPGPVEMPENEAAPVPRPVSRDEQPPAEDQLSPFAPSTLPEQGASGAVPAAIRSGGEADPPSPQANASSVKGYTLQVASVQSARQAEALATELKGKGYAAYTVRSEVRGKTFFQLRIGYYETQQDARTDMRLLRENQFDPILIKL
ncbi:MAG: type II secretion system secretin GspD [Desulfatitalea sp.]|nr:type II secretion system secretin GspD [Desulfatitalea sp.]NNK01419.1 type II secretion system secretin GspD [Desulfatitalea sp.]